MNHEKILKVLESLSSKEQISLLLAYGHQLSVLARTAYEFQGTGVEKPRLLRDVNEINHRIYPQVNSLVSSKSPELPNSEISSWISGEGRNEETQNASTQAFERALSLCNT
jgi:hypothetical protein